MKRRKPKPGPQIDIAKRINEEQRRLQKVAAILAWVTVAAEYSELDIDFGDVVGVALKLVQESVTKLDGMTLVV